MDEVERSLREEEDEPDWKTEYGKAISQLASVRNSYEEVLRSLWGAHPGDLPDIHYLTLNTSAHVINRGVRLLNWGDSDAPQD